MNLYAHLISSLSTTGMPSSICKDSCLTLSKNMFPFKTSRLFKMLYYKLKSYITIDSSTPKHHPVVLGMR